MRPGTHQQHFNSSRWQRPGKTEKNPRSDATGGNEFKIIAYSRPLARRCAIVGEADAENDFIHQQRVVNEPLIGRQIPKPRIGHLVGQLHVEWLKHHDPKAEFDTGRPAAELPPAVVNAQKVAGHFLTYVVWISQDRVVDM